MAIPKVAFASLPAAGSVPPGTLYLVTDIGSGGTFFESSGSFWRPLNGHAILAASAAGLSVTGTTSETTLATINLPAGLMTANGRLDVDTLWSMPNNANSKTMRVRLGGAGGTQFLSTQLTTQATFRAQNIIANRNSQSLQVGTGSSSTFSQSTGSPVTATVDTSAATTLVLSGQLQNAADTLTLEAYTVTLVIA